MEGEKNKYKIEGIQIKFFFLIHYSFNVVNYSHWDSNLGSKLTISTWSGRIVTNGINVDLYSRYEGFVLFRPYNLMGHNEDVVSI